MDQFNAGEAGAGIEGVAALDLDGVEGNEVVLLDSGIRKARVLRDAETSIDPGGKWSWGCPVLCDDQCRSQW
ncbi:MAG UNVERIFIED_CONTAM: hypothetical protein LVR18_13605 [Planctomycetaceae bacterium]